MGVLVAGVLIGEAGVAQGKPRAGRGRTELERDLRDVHTRSVLLAPRPGDTQLAIGDELLDDATHGGDGAVAALHGEDVSAADAPIHGRIRCADLAWAHPLAECFLVGPSLDFRKSYPDVFVVQPSQDRNGDNGSRSLDCSMQGRILL